MSRKLVAFLREEDGATMVEYGLMVALIAVVCIVTVSLLGGSLRTAFANTKAGLDASNNANNDPGTPTKTFP